MSSNRQKNAFAKGAIVSAVFFLIASAAAWAHGPQPVQLVANFHAALAAQEKDKALDLLLPEAVIYESGGAETVEQYGSHHLLGDMVFSAATQREILEQTKQVVGDIAWVMTRSRTTGAYKEREIDSIGVETVVLHHVKAGWRIAHIHWSSRSKN